MDDKDQDRQIDGKDAEGTDLANDGAVINISKPVKGGKIVNTGKVVTGPGGPVVSLPGPVDGKGSDSRPDDIRIAYAIANASVPSGEMRCLIGDSVWHRSIDGTEMATIRQGLGVTQAVFAAQCGHSQQFQVQIEQPGPHEISTDKARDIITAISFYKEE